MAKDNGCAWSLLIIGSCICFGLGLVLIGLSYYYFAPSGSCRCGAELQVSRNALHSHAMI